jgi:DNA polymerase
MSELHIDVETRSCVDLRKTGLFPYWEDPSTDLWGAAYCVDDGDVQRWMPGDPVPEAIAQAVKDGWLIFGHNVGFELAAWTYRLAPKYGWPLPDRKTLRCTAAMAAAMALPRALGDAATAMGLDEDKDQAGRRLMLQMAKPRRLDGRCGVCSGSGGIPGGDQGDVWTCIECDGTGRRVVWWDTPDRIERLMTYCEQDVRTERALTKRLRPLPPSELAIFQLDMAINWRGVAIDLPNVKRARRLVQQSLDALDGELAVLTRQRIERASQGARLIDWLAEHGVDTASLDKNSVSALLESVGHDQTTVRRVLEIRQEAAKSSTAKLEAMLLRTCADGRSRETLMYHGAGTGRWCLAEGSPVLTRNPDGTIGETPIEQVSQDQQVWDGTEWVSHEGVVFSGEKDVLEYDGVTATAEHRVFVSDTEYATLGEVARQGLPIFRGTNDPYAVPSV